MYSVLRRLLFCLPTETSHHLSLASVSLLQKCGLSRLVSKPLLPLPRTVMGIEFPNPVGLAAGLDKDAKHINGLSALGFGFIEVGTVTPKPQPGNPQPRLFRLPEAEAIINRMGFNNLGLDHLLAQVKASGYQGVLGINIGKNKDTPADKAVDDYLLCLRGVYPYASYVTVNLSSPNTPGLRDLQFGQPLIDLLSTLKKEQLALAEQHGRYIPMAVKIAPDMAEDDIRRVAEVFVEQGMDGVIATNTTIARDAVAGLANGDEQGGLSGKPVRDSSTKVVQILADALQGRLPIIGVGGISDGDSAAEKIAAGASLVQIYTGFIYRGPSLISEAAEAIAKVEKLA
ncbi:Dihydroorotate dehydrogenase (quinone) [Zhongshania aliphaticivorans]|uniref:Dihydroorotate dehydrogenase (quinone) n=1 Tax=Zhongshania aliphaticivorans TaxID=1470434 RepID=A0A5S9NAY7_9GAMM|nr:quinone-dependent dihydroorotate dehydrogenase [Zhongshania aliphaticivorans]CAA0087149.1 Dihydroorotate dehydrogenase (quinone) [Zhongshania aliphaticivorans]CAA0114145.1 Dihydroorotate dehydrogenase (quinone) [Zhongshania aliphaticivorans]